MSEEVERARSTGYKEGAAVGERIVVSFIAFCVASVVISFIGAILYSDVTMERQRTARIQAACGGPLDQPGPAMACALVSVRGRTQ